jgi:hypothetical protein
MNEPELGIASVDTQRVVRDLISAFDSLMAKPAPCIIVEAKPEQILAVESAEISKTPDDQMKDQRSPQEIIEEFVGDRELIERLRVTPHEIKSLTRSSLLGSLSGRQDLLFMLRLLREGPKATKAPATAPLGPVNLVHENVERAQPDHGEMAERIRVEALAKLTQAESSRKRIVGSGALRVFFSLLSVSLISKARS